MSVDSKTQHDARAHSLEMLLTRYRTSLRQKGIDISAAWSLVRTSPKDIRALEDFHQLVHKLSGSAPAYGFSTIGSLALEVSEKIRTLVESQDASALIALLDDAVLGRSVDALVRALDNSGSVAASGA